MIENGTDDQDRDKEAAEASKPRQKITNTNICLQELLENINKSKSLANISGAISSSNVNTSTNERLRA